jgi:hypothetical protein
MDRFAWLRAYGSREVKQIDITSRPAQAGTGTLALDSGSGTNTNYTFTIDAAREVTQLVVTAGRNSFFYSTIYISLPDPANPSGPWKSYGVTVSNGDTAIQVADKIRARSGGYGDYTVGGTTGTATVTFTAGSVGARGGITFDGGSTGVTATPSTTTVGRQDTTDQIAARIRALTLTGWTISGSGSRITLTGTDATNRIEGTYNDGASGAAATLQTVSDGGFATIHAFIKDSLGLTRSRKIFPSVTTTTVTDIEFEVSGAGTNYAVITVWGMVVGGTQGWSVLARFENVNLSSHPAGHHDIGVQGEGSAGSTWEAHIDSYARTGRGTTYFWDHDQSALGNIRLIHQIHHFAPPSQPTLIGVPIRDHREAVLPGQQYTLSFKARYHGLPAPAKPVAIEALMETGDVIELPDLLSGSVGAGTGVSGYADWQTYTRVYTIPRKGDPMPGGGVYAADCYELRMRSIDVGAGVVVLQQGVFSPGASLNPSFTYPTIGEFIATFDRDQMDVGTWKLLRQRVSLALDAELPAGVTQTVYFRSASLISGLVSAAWQTDVSQVADSRYVQVRGVYTGTGAQTPVVRPGSPYMEYIVRSGRVQEPILLNEYREELPGGILLDDVEEWSNRIPTEVHMLWNQQTQVFTYANPVGYLPPCEARCLTPAAKLYLEEGWQRPKYVEYLGQLVAIQITKQPDFSRQKGSLMKTTTGYKSYYEAPLAASQVLNAAPFGTVFNQ